MFIDAVNVVKRHSHTMASEMFSSQNTYTAREAALQSDKSQLECERANGNEVKRFENILGKSLSLMPKARYLYGDILICC